MSTKNPPTILKIATESLAPQKIVAFVGNTGSGKTVLGTMLKDAIYTHFIPKHKDEFSFNLIKGNDVLDEVEDYLFSQKIFPPETEPGTRSEMVFEVARTQLLGRKINIRIRDISGEDYKLAFYGDDVPQETRVNDVLTLKKEKTDSYGPFSFLIFAKLYVILIDCSKFREWKTIQTRQSQMLNSILAFKKILGETEDDKFVTPLAIILTKTDTLKAGIEESPEHMLEKYMPQFYHTLSYVHTGKRKYFSMFIEAEKKGETTQQPESSFQELTNATIPQTATKKLTDPLSYSSGEFVKFILWIIDVLS